tara:strand:- start:3770 stop:6145 length:2376 start_codon:yes stop_codon:yes gene_type:complete
MFIGEAPGYGEDKEGRPFIGPSGKLLDKLLEGYSELRRPSVYVTNVVKHRPPGNRTPLITERRPYLPYLYEEIRQVQPEVIVALGGVALWVFDKDLKVTSEHGRARLSTAPGADWEGVLVPWFHPAYALRTPAVMVQLHTDVVNLKAEVARVRAVAPTMDYGLADEDEVVAWLLAHWCELGFDTETTSPVRAKVFQSDEAEMVGYSVSTAPLSGRYIATTEMSVGMKGLLESPLWAKICHNAKFEMKVLAKQGVELNGWDDTALAAHLLGEPRIGLKVLSRQHLGTQPTVIKNLWPEGIANQPKDVAFQRYRDNPDYASADADNSARLWPTFKQRLVDEKLLSVYETIEKPLTPVLARMEGRGIGVDVERCREVAIAMKAPLTDSHGAARLAVAEAGYEPFSLGSRDQLAAMLEAAKAPLTKRTDIKRRLVVDANALRSIRDWWPEFIDPALDYYKYVKLIGYVHGFIALQAPDGRLHTSFNQAGHPEEDGTDPLSAPSTGRLSSSGPNLANIPHHRARVGEVDWGKEIRSCLVARPGTVLMSVDLSQEEPRIVAIAADDGTLLNAFNENRDIYRPATESLYPRICSEIDGESDSEFRRRFDYERFVGKTFFLAWYYGAGAGRLAVLDKEIDTTLAYHALEALKRAHPARDAYLDYIRQELYDHAMVTSLYGRKRWFWKAWAHRTIHKNARWPRGKDWESAVREAANMRIQATAADILKIAMAQIDTALTEHSLEARLVSTVYDEVVLELPRSEVHTVYEIIRDIFRPLLPGLDLEVEAKVGENWGYTETI